MGARFQIKRVKFWHVCARCGGEGRVWHGDTPLNFECPDCEGRGEIRNPRADAAYPWILRDAARPAFLGQYATLDRALDGVDAKYRDERNLPKKLDITRDEILARMDERYDAALEGQFGSSR